MMFYPLRMKFSAGGGANADLARLSLPEKRTKARKKLQGKLRLVSSSATSGNFE